MGTIICTLAIFQLNLNSHQVLTYMDMKKHNKVFIAQKEGLEKLEHP